MRRDGLFGGDYYVSALFSKNKKSYIQEENEAPSFKEGKWSGHICLWK